MNISANTQLGLRMAKPEEKIKLLEHMQILIKGKLLDLNGKLREGEEKIAWAEKLREEADKYGEISISEEAFKQLNGAPIAVYNQFDKVKKELGLDWLSVGTLTEMNGFLHSPKTKYFFICDSIYKAAELVRISESFTGRTYKDIDFGDYTYLLGACRMLRFRCEVGKIYGFFWDQTMPLYFEWGILTDSGEYYFDEYGQEWFTKMMQMLAFVELGDIEVTMIEGGRNNGKAKKDGKVANSSPNTVYVVDSSWNKLIIRTTGFAVRGHFRLQPCGPGHRDRKLIWLNAYEKSGYHRRPKARIVHETEDA